MRIKAMILTRYPKAYSAQKSQNQWVVRSGAEPSVELGYGFTAKGAWRQALMNLGFAEGMRNWHNERVDQV